MAPYVETNTGIIFFEYFTTLIIILLKNGMFWLVKINTHNHHDWSIELQKQLSAAWKTDAELAETILKIFHN